MRIANAPARKNERRIKAYRILELQLGELMASVQRDEEQLDKAKYIVSQMKILSDKTTTEEVARASRSKKYRTGGRRSMTWQ